MPIDPVCGVEVDEQDAITAVYEGRTYYFCNEDCRDEFMEAPEEYLAESSGAFFEEER